MMKKLSALFCLLLIALVACKSGDNRCAFDGIAVDPIYEIEITRRNGAVKKFCCVFCAQEWYGRSKRDVARITVTDEISGEKIDASAAYYVESEIFTQRHTRCRTHVFGQRNEAQRHAEQYDGRLVDDPFN